ncbi:LysR family transcriptional regulator, glycine cleavage system transcriptional activator/LysR family transcriptional regulator, regulator of gene expression of beta-lactamase [Rhizobiales bacterium GAS113]|nr:LysR family transcriptional regulator, glycine cleavage system transcriptional activator/LysR family transcriptional regulator, regulator of gene expression of beta-lactamase [Rhizobiales bacterium GAS113]
MATQTHLPPLTWLRSFEASARRQNFTAAGEELGLTQSAVSQHIKCLEEALGAALFRRLRRGVELTPEGGAYLPHVQAAFRSLASSTAELFGPRAGRVVTIRSPISFTALWLAPRLPAFVKTFPDTRLEIATIHVPADYAGEPEDLDIDFDIRFGIGPFADRESYRLTFERLVPAAAPELMRGLHEPADWAHLPLLSVSGAREMWPAWFACAGLPPPGRAFLICDSFVVAFEAARAGAGVLLASRPLADAALAEGRLLRLSEIELAGEAGHFITHKAGRALAPHDQAVLDWMRSQANA